MSFDKFAKMLNGPGDFEPENRIKGHARAGSKRRRVDPEVSGRAGDRSFFFGVASLSWWGYWTCSRPETNYRRLSASEQQFLQIANCLGEEEAFARLTAPVGCNRS